MKILLTDIDGVVLNWSDHFQKYLKQYYPDVALWDPTVFAQADGQSSSEHANEPSQHSDEPGPIHKPQSSY